MRGFTAIYCQRRQTPLLSKHQYLDTNHVFGSFVFFSRFFVIKHNRSNKIGEWKLIYFNDLRLATISSLNLRCNLHNDWNDTFIGCFLSKFYLAFYKYENESNSVNERLYQNFLKYLRLRTKLSEILLDWIGMFFFFVFVFSFFFCLLLVKS